MSIRFSKLIAIMLLLSLCFSCAHAQEEVIHGHVELFSEGAIIEQTPVLASTFSTATFDSYVAAQLDAQASSIDVSRYSLIPDDFYAAYGQLLNSRPELFFVSGAYDLYWDGVYVTEFVPYYNYTGDELTEIRQIYDDGISAIVDYAMQSETDIGRMLRASDYMCVNYEYDLTYEIYSPELLIRDKTGVCQAYMLVYRAVLNELDITNITVASNEINHTWNMVCLGDSWYHIDTTWNDPVPDMPHQALHNNFLLSDSAATATGHTSWDDAWETVLTADDTQYDDYFWRSIYQALAMNGDIVYSIASTDSTTANKSIYSHNLETGVQKKVFTYDYGYDYTDYVDMHPVWFAEDTLYYGIRGDLYKLPLSSSTSTKVYSTGSASKWIWSPWQSGTKLLLHITESPDVAGTIAEYQLETNAVVTLSPSAVLLDAGETVRLNASLTGAPSSAALSYSSSDKTVATVSSTGKVTAVGTGIARITAAYGTASAACTVAVMGENTLYLPADTLTVAAEAFRSTAFRAVSLPEGLKNLLTNAFADNEDLLLVNMPESLTLITSNAFSGCSNVTLLCKAGSTAETFAINNNLPYIIIP